MNTQQYRYKIYDILPGKKYCDVIGVSGRIINTFKSEAQAKKWIDKEWKLSQKKIKSNGFEAWYTGDGNWTISDGSSSVGSAKLFTERRCREDWSGLKKFKVITENKIKLTIKVTWKNEITIDETFIERCSLDQAIKRMINFVKNGSGHSCARMQLEQQARELGISEWKIIECYDQDGQKHCQNIFWLIQGAIYNEKQN